MIQSIDDVQLAAIKEIHALISSANKNPSEKTVYLLGVLKDIIDGKLTSLMPTTINLSGKLVVFTGTLKTMTRNDAFDHATNARAKVTNSLSGKTDFLVVGDKPGLKLDQAKELGVTILNENEFRRAVGL
jgi:DNA ligase (NAD+)